MASEQGTKGVKVVYKKSSVTGGQESLDVKHIFQFTDYGELDKCRERLGKALSRLREPPKPAETSETPSELSTEIPSELSTELVLRIKLLKENSELQNLHKRCVGEGILTDAEFWAPRKKLLDGDSSRKPKQRAGLKSVMLSDSKTSADGRVTFNLTPEIAHEIFAQKPAVHRGYMELVVHGKMTNTDFWTKYYRAEYLQRSDNVHAAAAEAAEDEDLALFLKPDDILAHQNRQKMRWVDPTINLVADQDDDYTHIGGHKIYRREETTESGYGQYRRTLAQEIYRHSAAVLEGASIGTTSSMNWFVSDTTLIVDVEQLEDAQSVAKAFARSKRSRAAASTGNEEVGWNPEQERLKRISKMMAVEDLQAPKNPPFLPLNIKDPRDYFDSQQATALVGNESVRLSTREAYPSLREGISSLIEAKGLVIHPITKPEDSLKVLTLLNRNISSTTTTYDLGKKNRGDRLPDAIKEELQNHSRFINELLRHFWSPYPTTSTHLYAKVTKLKDASWKMDSQLKEMKESVQSDLRHGVTLPVRPLQQQLEAALEHYDADLQRRSVSGAPWC